MVAFAPFDPGSARSGSYVVQAPVIQNPQVHQTECNYLVMFFVLSVFAMAIFDGLRK